MCLAVPAELISIDGLCGIVASGGVRREVRLDLIEQPAIGDLLLVHAGFAIERVDGDRAREINEALQSPTEQDH